MELGLTARVDAKIDERSVSDTADRLEERIQNQIGEIDVPVADMSEDFDGMIENANEMNESVRTMNESWADMGSALEQFEGSDVFAATVGPGSPSDGGDDDGMESRVDRLMDFVDRFGEAIAAGGVSVLLGGLALELLSEMSSAIQQTANINPLLGAVVDMFGQTLMFLVYPFADLLARFLLPIATSLLQLSARFTEVYSEGGIFAAMEYLISNGFGIVGLLVASALRKIQFAKVLLSRVFPSVGEKGIIGAVFSKVKSASLVKSIFTKIKSNRLVSWVFSKVGGGAIVGKVFGKIGGSKILQRIGLSSIGKLLSGRLLTFIPVIGQVLTVFDLLVMGITALLPNVEMFSPVGWVLGKIIDAGKGLVGWLMSLPQNIAEMSIGSFIQPVKKLLNWFMSNLGPILTMLSPFLMIGMIGFRFIMGLYNWFKEKLVPKLKGALSFGGDLISGAISFLKGKAKGIVDWITGKANGLREALGDAQEWVSGKAEGVKEALGDAADWVSGKAQGVKEAFGDAAGWIQSKGKGVRDALGDVSGWVQSKGSGVKQALADTAEWIGSKGNGVKNALSDAADSISKKGSSVKSALGDVGSWIGNKGSGVKSALSGVANSITNEDSNLRQALNDIIQTAKKRFTAVRTELTSNLKSIPSKIFSAIPTISVDQMQNAINLPDFSRVMRPIISGLESFGNAVSDITDWLSNNIPNVDVSVPDIDVPDLRSDDRFETGESEIPYLQTGGQIETSGLAFVHSGETVLPPARAERLNMSSDQSFGTNRSADGMNVSVDTSSMSRRDLERAFERSIGDQLDNVEAAITSLASEISGMEQSGSTELKVDGKRIAKAEEQAREKYVYAREVIQ